MGQAYDHMCRVEDDAITDERRDELEKAATVAAGVCGLSRWELVDVLHRSFPGSPVDPKCAVELAVMAGPHPKPGEVASHPPGSCPECAVQSKHDGLPF